VVGGSIEFFGGLAVGLGIFGRLAGAGLVGDMAMAMATVTFANGIASTAPGGGYELNLALAALAFVVALLGTGRFSLDVALRARWEGTRSSKPKAVGEVGHDERPDRIRGPASQTIGKTPGHRSARLNGRSGSEAVATVGAFLLAEAGRILAQRPHVVLYGDQALLELGARRAIHLDQLVGPYSRSGFHHPGPALFYVLAPFVRLLEPTGPGLYLGAVIVNAAAPIAAVTVVWRRVGALAALWAAAAIGLFCLCLGVGTVREPWNPYLVVAPMVCSPCCGRQGGAGPRLRPCRFSLSVPMWFRPK
jgi:hypothetical protein